MKNIIILIGIIIVEMMLCGLPQASAQSYQRVAYQAENGLPTNLTKAIAQDELGFIWIASDEGVSRFDGRSFMNFKRELPVSYTKSLYTTKQGKLYIVNDLGIIGVESRLDTAGFKMLLAGASQPNATTPVIYPKDIYEDCNGNLWISEPGSITRYRNGQRQRYDFEQRWHTTIYLRSFHLAQLACGDLYAGVFMGALFYYDSQQNKFVQMDLGDFKLADIASVRAYNAETLWIGYAGGVAEVRVSRDKVVSVRNIAILRGVSYLHSIDDKQVLVGTWERGLWRIIRRGEQYQLSQVREAQARVINHINTDKERNVWLSTDDGIELLRPNLFIELQLAPTSAYIQGITEGNPGEMLVCDGSSVHSITRADTGFALRKLYTYPNSNILSLAHTQNRLYMGAGNNRLVVWQDGQAREIDLSPYGKAVFSLSADRAGRVWACQYDNAGGVVRIDENLQTKFIGKDQGILGQITLLRQAPDGTLYAGGQGKDTYLYRYRPQRDGFENISIPIDIKSDNVFVVNDMIFDSEEQIWLGTNQGLWIKKGQTIRQIDLGTKYRNENIKALWLDRKGNAWIGTNLGIIKFQLSQESILFEKSNGLTTVTITPRGLVRGVQDFLFVATAQGLNYLAEPTESLRNQVKLTPTPVFLSLRTDENTPLKPEGNVLLSFRASITAKILAFTFPNERVQYQYRVKGLSEAWSVPSTDNQILLQRLPAGNYVLEIRAKQQGNYTWSIPAAYRFSVAQAWYVSPAAISAYVIMVVLLISLSVSISTRRLQAQRKLLTERVQAATQEIAERAESLRHANEMLQAQTEQINRQKENIEFQKNTIENALQTIQRKNRQITDSIRYAQTIQRVILPTERSLKKLFPDYFLIYQPKDVVSGDFYWAMRIHDKVVVAVVDCTGHGVPGAFMSMIGSTLMHRIVKIGGVTDPARILTMLHAEVRVVMRQRETNNNDGMDACLSILQRISERSWGLTFCGAKRPLYYFTQGSMQMIDANRRSVGGDMDTSRPFQNSSVLLESGDMVYLTTDGFADQNNEKRRKFGEAQLLRILERHAHQSSEEQYHLLTETLAKYQGTAEQRDDITILGIRLG